MPLDPVLRKVLDSMPDVDNFDYSSIDIGEYRKMEEAGTRNGKPATPGISSRDYSIDVEGGSIRARLYSPNTQPDALIVFYHGGGFVFGTIETYDYICRAMALYSGCKILSVAYRLAPEHKFPTAVNDAFTSYLWAMEHSEKLGVKSHKIAVAGDSAGGNLAAAVSLKCLDEGKRMPAAQLLLYPVMGFDTASLSQKEFSSGYNLNNSYTRWFTERYLRSWDDVMSPYFSIMNHKGLSSLPETIVFTAEFDTLRDPAEQFVYMLREAGTEATGVRALGMFHAFASHIEASVAARNFLRMACGLIAGKIL